MTFHTRLHVEFCQEGIIMDNGESVLDPQRSPQPATRKRKLRLSLLVIVGLAVAASGSWIAWNALHGWTQARLEARITAELPTGYTREDAEGFLDRHGIYHEYYPGVKEGSFNDYAVKTAGLSERDVAGVVTGHVTPGEANEHWLLPSDIDIHFFIDPRGKVIGHWVDPIIYGP
jgi:hypothetical protein